MKKTIYVLLLFLFGINIVSAASCAVVNGTGKNIGDEIACGSEQFYVVSNDGENIKMLGKYNLLVGKTYYNLTFQKTYSNVNDIYYEKGLQQKIKEGYVIYTYKRIYDPNAGQKVYNGVILRKDVNVTSSKSKYIFYDTNKKIEEILRSSEVKKYFEEGYSYSPFKASAGGYLGISLSKSNTYTYSITILDESYETHSDMLHNTTIKNTLENSYFDSYITDSDGKYIGIKAYKRKNYEYKTIILDSEVDTPYILEEEKLLQEIQTQGWAVDKTIPGTGTYTWYGTMTLKKSIGIVLYKQEGYEYKTIPAEYKSYYAPETNELKIYNQQEITKYYEEGYIPKKYHYFTYTRIIGGQVNYGIYGVTLMKDSEYEYYNVMFDELISSSTIDNYIENNEQIKLKKQEGFTITKNYQIYTEYNNGTSYYETYGVQMRKVKSTSSTISNTDATNENFTKVYQHESAIGAHGEQHGAPAPEEVGVVDKGSFSFTYNSEEIYEEGFVDYVYSENSSVYNYLDYYKKTLKDEGYNIKAVDSIAISDISEFAYQTTGEYLPLQEWYENSEEYGNDPVHDTEFWILANLNDYIPEEYSWLWSTTYWTRTTNPNGDYYYFVDTLGDLCSIYYCDGVIGAGIRPLVTISTNDITYNVQTKTDGNGKVEATHDSAKSGDEVKFTIEPESGYKLKEIKVTDYEGNVIISTENTFTMPNSNVLIEATFEIKNPNTISLSIIAALMFSILSIIIVKVNYKKMKWLNE